MTQAEERLKLAYNKGFGWRTLVADKAVTSSAQKIISLASHGIAVNSETARPMVRYLADLENENMMSIPERHSVGGWATYGATGFHLMWPGWNLTGTLTSGICSVRSNPAAWFRPG